MSSSSLQGTHQLKSRWRLVIRRRGHSPSILSNFRFSISLAQGWYCAKEKITLRQSIERSSNDGMIPVVWVQTKRSASVFLFTIFYNLEIWTRWCGSFLCVHADREKACTSSIYLAWPAYHSKPTRYFTKTVKTNYHFRNFTPCISSI